MLSRVFDGLLDLLAPQRCSACASIFSSQAEPRASTLSHSGEPFCAACSPLLEPLQRDVGLPYRALFRYGGPIADAIRRLKYEGVSEVARALGPELSAAVLDWQNTLDAVTAIPLAAGKLRTRGYNQSGLLARQVASSLMLPFEPLWLRRAREGQRQVGQSRAARRAQAQGAFVGSPRARGKVVLVIDDVRTTGATLAAASSALEQAGASAVYQLVLAEAEERAGYGPLY